MRIFWGLVTLLLFLLITVTQTVKATTAPVSSNLKVDNITLEVPRVGLITGSYTVTNEGQKTENELRYLIVLREKYTFKTTNEGGTTVQVAQDGKEIAIEENKNFFSLFPGEKKTEQFTLAYSTNIKNDQYELLVNVVNSNNDVFTSTPIKISLAGNSRYLKIGDCKVTIDGQDYGTNDGALIDPGKQVLASCSVSNPTTQQITGKISYLTGEFLVYGYHGQKTNEAVGDSFSVNPNETKTLNYKIPPQQKPGVYQTLIYLKDFANQDVSPASSSRWTVKGEGARINNLILDQNTYQKGQTAQVEVFFAPSGDLYWQIVKGIQGSPLKDAKIKVVISSNNKECGQKIEDLPVFDKAKEEKVAVAVPITKNCPDPKVEASIEKQNLDKPLAKLTLISASTPQEKQQLVQTQSSPKTTKYAIFGLIVLSLGLIGFLAFKKLTHKTITAIYIILGVGLYLTITTTPVNAYNNLTIKHFNLDTTLHYDVPLSNVSPTSFSASTPQDITANIIAREDDRGVCSNDYAYIKIKESLLNETGTELATQTIVSSRLDIPSYFDPTMTLHTNGLTAGNYILRFDFRMIIWNSNVKMYWPRSTNNGNTPNDLCSHFVSYNCDPGVYDSCHPHIATSWNEDTFKDRNKIIDNGLACNQNTAFIDGYTGTTSYESNNQTTAIPGIVDIPITVTNNTAISIPNPGVTNNTGNLTAVSSSAILDLDFVGGPPNFTGAQGGEKGINYFNYFNIAQSATMTNLPAGSTETPDEIIVGFVPTAVTDTDPATALTAMLNYANNGVVLRYKKGDPKPFYVYYNNAWNNIDTSLGNTLYIKNNNTTSYTPSLPTDGKLAIGIRSGYNPTPSGNTLTAKWDVYFWKNFGSKYLYTYTYAANSTLNVKAFTHTSP